MNLGYFNYPLPVNEPVLNYAPGSDEKKRLKETLAELKSKAIDVPMYIGSDEVRTGKKVAINPPHEHQHVLGYFHQGDARDIDVAAALGGIGKQDLDAVGPRFLVRVFQHQGHVVRVAECQIA